MITIYSQPSVSVGVSLLAQSLVKNLPAVQEIQVQSVGQEDPLKEGTAITQVFLSRELHGQRSLAGSSPWGRRVRHN